MAAIQLPFQKKRRVIVPPIQCLHDFPQVSLYPADWLAYFLLSAPL